MTSLAIVRRQELTQVGRKSVSVYGFRHDLMEEHLVWHLTQMSNKWCSVECMARTMFGRNTETNRTGVRKRMANAFRTLLSKRGLLLVIEYDVSPTGHGKIKACKLFESGEGAERQYAKHQVERMEQRKQMNEEQVARALSVINR